MMIDLTKMTTIILMDIRVMLVMIFFDDADGHAAIRDFNAYDDSAGFGDYNGDDDVGCDYNDDYCDDDASYDEAAL